MPCTRLQPGTLISLWDKCLLLLVNFSTLLLRQSNSFAAVVFASVCISFVLPILGAFEVKKTAFVLVCFPSEFVLAEV